MLKPAVPIGAVQNRTGFALDRAAIAGLKPGQILQAVTLTNSDQGHVRLRIGGAVLSASTHISFPSNTPLLLEVARLQPQLLLKLVSPTTENSVSQRLQAGKLALLSRQTGLAPSLAALIRGATASDPQHGLQSVNAELIKLMNALPHRTDLCHGPGLRQAMLLSGVFLEAHLARQRQNHKADVSKDIKACLLRLIAKLERHKQAQTSPTDVNRPDIPAEYDSVVPPRRKRLPAPQKSASFLRGDKSGLAAIDPGNLVQNASGAIARLGLLQLTSADGFDKGEASWHLELPLIHDDAIEIVSLSIERKPRYATRYGEDQWILTLAVDTPRLGCIEIRVSTFRDGVSVCFWAGSERTSLLVEREFDRLRTAMKQHGVGCLHLFSQQGKANTDESYEDSKPNIEITA